MKKIIESKIMFCIEHILLLYSRHVLLNFESKKIFFKNSNANFDEKNDSEFLFDESSIDKFSNVKKEYF